jgi:hypothetical protein
VSSNPIGSHPLARNCKIKSNKPTKAKRKIFIIGDNHACGIASEILLNLDNDFEIQGIVKSVSDLAAIKHTVNRDTSTLTKHDAVVEWGGTRDISRNESQKGLCQIRNFMEKHSHTNVLVVNVLKTFDLETHFCVNYEVNTFKQKIR